MRLYGAVFCLVQGILCHNALPRIAVIGGGIGGATSAYSLRQSFEETPIALDLYEPGPIGGRLATVSIAGRMYEAGGSVIHPANRHMLDFLKLSGLNKKESGDGGLMGIYDGENYPFQESSYDFVTYFRLLWRYGADIFKLRSLINETVEKFIRIYKFQEKNYAFTNLNQMLQAMSPQFPNMTQMTTVDYLKSLNIGERITSELIESVMNVNYGQTTAINAFVGSVSLGGGMPGLWSVEGGNKLIAERLIQHSAATVKTKPVTEIHLQSDNKFKVFSKESYEIYDIVIIATPLNEGMSDITFKGFPDNNMVQKGSYHRTVATFVEGEINLDWLGLERQNNIQEILVNNPKLFFSCVGKIYPVDYKSGQVAAPSVFKVFSPKPLTDSQLDNLFSTVTSVKIVDWLAYPNYTVPDPMGSFVLFNNLFYTSSIEWAASAMEMSAISGKNAALLAYHSWRNSTGRINPNNVVLEHIEL